VAPPACSQVFSRHAPPAVGRKFSDGNVDLHLGSGEKRKERFGRSAIVSWNVAMFICINFYCRKFLSENVVKQTCGEKVALGCKVSLTLTLAPECGLPKDCLRLSSAANGGTEVQNVNPWDLVVYGVFCLERFGVE